MSVTGDLFTGTHIHWDILSLVCQPVTHTYVYQVIVEVYRNIKTHGSELLGQEEAGLHDESVSYLQVAPL